MSLNFSFSKRTWIIFLVVFLAVSSSHQSRGAAAASTASSSSSSNLGSATNKNKKFTPPEYKYDNVIPPQDPFNNTVSRINDTNATYWLASPHYYNGTHYFDGNQTFPCVAFKNGSNGTNCSKIYGDLYLRGYYDQDTTRCQITLMQSYGFEGMPMAIKQKINLCPNIENSCCSQKDFFNAFRSWEHDGIQSNLVERVNFLNNTYAEFITALNSAYNMISNIVPKIPVTNNCKVLGNTIMAYNFGDVSSYLMSTITQYYAYLSKNFESFYCTMCNAHNHPFFDLTRQRIVIHHKQCRSWARNTLPFLLYFHVHLVKISNLIVDFVSSCDANGQFNKMHIDESLFKMQVSRKVQRKILRCRNERDASSWFKACAPICREMSLTKISPFMTPNLRKMTSIASFVKGNVQILKNQIFNSLNADQVSGQKANNARVLAATKAKSKSKSKKLRSLRARKDDGRTRLHRRLQQSRPAQKYNHQILRTLNYENFERTMIPTALNARVDLDNLQPAFASDGLDLEEVLDTMSWVPSSYGLAFDKWAAQQKFNDNNLAVHYAFSTIARNASRFLAGLAALLLWRLV